MQGACLLHPSSVLVLTVIIRQLFPLFPPLHPPPPVGVDPALSGEPSQALERATEKAQKLGLTLRGVGGIAEELPFESGSFDAVVSTLVFCSVRDPAAALREVGRPFSLP